MRVRRLREERLATKMATWLEPKHPARNAFLIAIALNGSLLVAMGSFSLFKMPEMVKAFQSPSPSFLTQIDITPKPPEDGEAGGSAGKSGGLQNLDTTISKITPENTVASQMPTLLQTTGTGSFTVSSQVKTDTQLPQIQTRTNWSAKSDISNLQSLTNSQISGTGIGGTSGIGSGRGTGRGDGVGSGSLQSLKLNTSQKLGLIIDVSGSMLEHQKAVMREAKKFRSKESIDHPGARVDDQLLTAIQILIEKGCTNIVFLSDFQDGEDPASVVRIGELLARSKAKLHSVEFAKDTRNQALKALIANQRK